MAANDPLTQISILRIGVRRPARILIRFVDDEFEGRQDWVPPSRLSTPWSQAEEFLAWECRWQTVVDASSVAGTPDEHAASYIFDAFIDRDLASTDINGAAGVSLIHDVAGLAQLLEIAPTLLTCEPIAFIDDHALVVPWSITERIARTAARHNSAAVRDHVRTVDAAYLRNTLHGAYLVSRGRDDTYVEADWFVRNRNAPQNAPYWELLRAWSGSHAEQTLNELDEYRRGVARASATAREAISLLRDKGLRRDADRLERQLAEMA